MTAQTGAMPDQAAAPPHPDPVNDVLRVLLARRDLRAGDVGQAIGVTQTQVSARLNGRIDWRLSELRTVAELLGVRLGDLINAELAVPTASA